MEADGGSRGNPGPAGYGAVVSDAVTGETLAEAAEYLGVATNNVAEYRGLLAGLRVARELDPTASVHVRMDSKLVVEQMSGRWKIKHPAMKPLAAEAARVFPPGRVTYEWVPRASNKHADRLANEAMDAGARGEQWSPSASTAELDTAGAGPSGGRAARGRRAGGERGGAAAGAGAGVPAADAAGQGAGEGAAAEGERAARTAPAAPTSASGASGAGRTADSAASGAGRTSDSAASGPERTTASATSAASGADRTSASADSGAGRTAGSAASGAGRTSDSAASGADRTTASATSAASGADRTSASADSGAGRTADSAASAAGRTSGAPAARTSASADSAAAPSADSAGATASRAAGSGGARTADSGGVTAADGDVRAAKAVASPGWGPPDLGTPATFVLLRHGETPLTPQKRFSGSGGSDPSLSAVGREQAARVAEGLARRGTIQAIVASPLARTRETAAVVAARLGLEVTVEEGLRETDFGAWEGLTFGEVRERYPDDLNAWLASPEAEPTGGGESFTATGARIAATRDRLVSAYAGRTVLLVSHVTPIKTFVQLALGAPPESLFRMELSAASLSAVAYYADGGASVRLFNETSHLR
ncbi:bifunctional RNase H/acid phosphatase [Streptomyces sp. NPDC048219]|uniref:bifunctional RNase H/acid phosphatase n=1 Tax=Streptomyces sp. NPDC048219 TaxID=3365517 RepID=UPI00371B0D33